MPRGNMKRRNGVKRNSNNNKRQSYNKKDNEYGHPKRKRAELQQITNSLPESEEISSEEECDDQYKQLLAMLPNNSQQSRLLAAISDESESDSDEQDSSVSENEGNVAIESSVSESLVVKEKEHLGESSLETDYKLPGEEEDLDIDEETEKEEPNVSTDPFTLHLHWQLSPGLLKSVSSEEPSKDVYTSTWPTLGHLITQIPRSISVENKVGKVSIQENVTYAPIGKEPIRINEPVDWNKLHVKQQIQGHIEKANSSSGGTGVLTPLQQELFSIVNNYQDLYYPERTHQTGEEIRFIYCLHAVNHMLKSRIKVLHHNTRLLKKTEVPDEYRDQGLVRPKVIILLPFRETALRTINMIATILLGSTKGTVINYKRFLEEFAGSELFLPRKNRRPEDYEQTFTGNTDDDFRIGITVTKKCLKLYADFYDSDLIIASPLGLRMIVGAEGEANRDYDFLASVELLVLDQADIFMQQNWDHLIHVWEHLHKQPKESHEADFSRLRLWALAGHACYYRQTLIFSGVSLPELQALISRRCHNYAGLIRVVNPIILGSICQVVLHMPQVFHRMDASSPTQSITARFEMFTNKILPQFRERLMSHTMIFVSSYFDYVRVRNYFKRHDISFVQICEYSKDGKIARARDLFFHNEAHFLLYSERFHFFRRIRVKGIRHLIFYQPPIYPHFYSEMCNMMQEMNQNPREGGGTETHMSVTVLYCKYDAQRLAGILGSERASRMLESERKVHLMVTGD